MMNYSGPDKKNSGSSFDNQDFGIYGRGYKGYAHYIVTTHNSCQNGHIHQNTPGKPELSKVLPR